MNKFICGICSDYCSEYTYNEKKDVDVCNRCKDEINENDEIHYPNDKAVCEYCIESKECDKLYNN